MLQHFVATVIIFITIGDRIKATIVYPKMLESRTEDGLKILKINDDITLKLTKTDFLPEDFLVYSTKDGTPIAYHMRGADVEEDIYEDAEQMATLHVTEASGISVEGVLGNNLRIRPLEGLERSMSGESAHELYEIEHPENMGHRHDDNAVPPVNGTRPVVESRSVQWPSAPRIPVLIHPEVHIVVDYLICAALNFDERKISKYVAILVHSANLRYRSMIQPRVQLALVGVSVTKTEAEEPYMVHVPGYKHTRNILYGDTIKNFNEHVKQKPYFQSSDVVFLLTGLNMSEWNNNVLQHWVGGFAYVAGACTQWRVGMSEERVKSYYGVYVLAHEIAHNLGCNHDGDGANNWPAGHIGSKDCPWAAGFMMSYEFKKPNMYRFSYCCQRELMNLYNRPEYKCLSVKNSVSIGITSSKFPGQVSHRQTYCEKVYHSYSYVHVDKTYDISKCIVKCFINRDGDNMLISAVDGVRCGSGKICALGNCTSKADLKKDK